MSFAPSAQASPEAEQLTRDLSNDLMSPYCPGRTISSCPSEQARKLEDYIMEQAEAGKSREEIETILVGRFGREKLGSKTDPLVLYGSLGAALAAGLLIVFATRKWLRPAPAAASAVASGGGAPRPERPRATQAELDGLEDALDDLEEF